MITIIARMTAKAGEFDNMRAYALELSRRVSESEPDNALYAICEGGEPNQLILVERYKDEASIEAHRRSEHLRELGKKIGATLAFPHEVLFRLTDCV
jgi:quinol monooxygenase YgiN